MINEPNNGGKLIIKVYVGNRHSQKKKGGYKKQYPDINLMHMISGKFHFNTYLENHIINHKTITWNGKSEYGE